jgi:hypothetical protein
MIAEIPTMAIETVIINQNTSIIPDEVLAHRLGLIPILADANDFEEKKEDEDFNEKNSLKFTLNVKCEKNKNGKIINEQIFSGDLKLELLGNQKNKFFNEKNNTYSVGLVNDDIYLNKLTPGMEIDLVCYCVKGIGRTHAKWSPVCTAYYKLLNKINILKEKFILFSKIKSEAKLFKNNVAVARTYMIGMKDLIKSLEQKLYDHLYGFTSQLNKIKNIESDLDEIKEDQENIQNKLNKINYYQEQIIVYLTELNNNSYLKKIALNNKSININDKQQINKNKSNLSDENAKKFFNFEKPENIRPKKSFNLNKNTAINLVINKKYNFEIKKSEKNFKYTILSGKSNKVGGKKNKDKSNLTIKLLSTTNLVKIKRSKSQKNKIKRIFKFSKIENKSIVNDLKFRRLITKKDRISNFKLFSNDLKRSNKKYY